jgi:hypothetical protein
VLRRERLDYLATAFGYVLLRVHMDDMQTRSHPSITSHLHKKHKVSVVTKSILIRGRVRRKLRDTCIMWKEGVHLGP